MGPAAHRGPEVVHTTSPHPLFICVEIRKKINRGKKERVSKQKLLKDCHQGQNVTLLAILESLEFKNFYCRPNVVADNTFQFSWSFHFEIYFTGPLLVHSFRKMFIIGQTSKRVHVTYSIHELLLIFLTILGSLICLRHI